MTREEVSLNYQIPIEILQQYEKWDLFDNRKKEMGKWQYDDQDLELLSLILTLHDIGFNKREIQQYMLLYRKEETNTECIRILKQKRGEILNGIHVQEKRLEYLDYLRYKVQKSMEKKESK